ncbi:hypothetical protein [Streptomyces sp. NPDC048639]|uniref:hypothetical protein n=1 Tax=Streptomyces sp. NPDC048639 TaxID=3365581 RepID=UPI00371D8D70
MSDRPTQDQAAQALQGIRQRQGEALAGRQEARWVQIMFAVLAVAWFASYDVFQDPGPIPYLVFAGVMWTYLLASRTRKGAALLGHRSTGLRNLPGAYIAIVLGIFTVVMVAGGYIGSRSTGFLHDHVPYWHSLLGLVLTALAFPFARLGQKLQLWLLDRTRTRKQGL